MKKQIKFAAAVLMSAAVASVPVFAANADSVHTKTLKPARTVKVSDENDGQFPQFEEGPGFGKGHGFQDGERPEMPERPEMTEEQKAEMAQARDERVAELEKLIEEYKSAESEEDKAAAYEKIQQASRPFGGREHGNAPFGKLGKDRPEDCPRMPEMTEEEKVAWEENRAKIAELKEKLKGELTEEEKAEIMAEIKALMEQLCPEKPAEDNTGAKAAAASLQEQAPADAVDMQLEFTDVPSES